MTDLYLYHFSTKDFSQFNLEMQNPLHQALGAGIYTSDTLNFVQGEYDFTQTPNIKEIEQKRISVNHAAYVDIDTYALFLQKKFNLQNLDLIKLILTERTDFPKQKKNDLLEKYQYDYVKNKQLQNENVQKLLSFLYEKPVQCQIVQIPIPQRRVYKCFISDEKGIIDGSKTLKESKIKKIDVADICDILDIDTKDMHRLLFRTEYLMNLKNKGEWRRLWNEKQVHPSYREKVVHRNNVLKKLSKNLHTDEKINQYEKRFKELKAEIIRLNNIKNKTDEDRLSHKQLEKEIYTICGKILLHYFYHLPYGLIHKNFIKTPRQCQKLSQYLGIKGLYAYQVVPNFDKRIPYAERKQAFEKWVVLTDVKDVRIETYIGYDTKGKWQPVKRPPNCAIKNTKQKCLE